MSQAIAERIPEEVVKETAYYLWEQEGRPHGRDLEHYLTAHQLVLDYLTQHSPERVEATTYQGNNRNGKVTTPAAALATPADHIEVKSNIAETESKASAKGTSKPRAKTANGTVGTDPEVAEKLAKSPRRSSKKASSEA